MKIRLMGYDLFSSSAKDCVEEIFRTITQSRSARRQGHWGACLNPHSYCVARSDRYFREALHDADWLVPDGIGVYWASIVLDKRLSQRITGSDLFYGVNGKLNSAGGYRVFFLGSSDRILARIRFKMSEDFPNIIFAGAFAPPFKAGFSTEDTLEMISAVNSAAPDVLWVGLTAPKQEKWIYENLPRLNVSFAGAIGAVFDFYAGEIRRSPPFLQRIGLEWLPRFVQQPRRLWRRIFISGPVFILDVWKAHRSDRA